MSPPAHVPECLACGACCFGPGERYVRVTGDDYARLGEQAEELAHFVGHRCYMRMTDGHCAALELREGRYTCRAYERRPQVCRDLERGGPACQAELTRASPVPGRLDTRLPILLG